MKIRATRWWRGCALALPFGAACHSGACPDTTREETFTVDWDQLTRAAGDDGILTDAECLPFCSTYTDIETIETCTTDVPDFDSGVDTGLTVSVTCTGAGGGSCE